MVRKREHWIITLEPLEDEVPARFRMRHLLKFALRYLRLRCVSIQPPPDREEDKPCHPPAA